MLFSPWGTSVWRPSEALAADSNTEPQGLRPFHPEPYDAALKRRTTRAPVLLRVDIAAEAKLPRFTLTLKLLGYGVISHTTPA